ncbi:MAG: transporter substrate-binding domain-containing protein, partial [Burkholderiales bacterium]|nr:transporter substrate-binding domain-containing protein [Burkholderiales bacterium]
MEFLRKIALVGIAAWLLTCSAFAQKLTVVTEEYPPYNFLSSDNKISGMATEVVEEVLLRAKVDYQLGIYPWARAYKMAQEAPYVLIYAIGRNEKREALFKWMDVIAPYDVYLYRLKSRSDIHVNDLADLKNFEVGAVRDDVRAQYLEKLGAKPDLASADSANIKKLAMERIDMFPIDEAALIGLYKREGIDPGTVVKALKLEGLSSGLYMAFSKQTPDEMVSKC